MRNIKIELTSTCKLNLQIDSSCRIYIARMEIADMPMQSREHFGNIYPTSMDILNGLMTYGFNVCEWSDNISDATVQNTLKENGILSYAWFKETILDCWYPEEIEDE